MIAQPRAHGLPRFATLAAAGAAAFCLTTAGCGSGSSSTPFTSSTGTVGSVISGTRARAFNAIEGGTAPNSNVVFTLGSTRLNSTGLASGSGTSYATVNSGTSETAQITLASTVSGTNNLVAQQTVTVAANNAYTLVGVGNFTSTGSGAPQLLVFPDSTPTLTNTTTAGLRLINATNGLQPLTVSNTVGTAVTPIVGLTGIASGGVSSANNSPYILLSSNNAYNLTIRDNAGSVVQLPTTTVASLSNLTLAAGHSYTLLVYGTPGTSIYGTGTFNAMLAEDN